MIYADSSFLVALKVRRDTFHKEALDFYEPQQDETWLWCPWHRVEVFNTIRQLTRHPQPKRRLLGPEARALIHHLEADVRLGYFTHVEADWRVWRAIPQACLKARTAARRTRYRYLPHSIKVWTRSRAARGACLLPPGCPCLAHERWEPNA